MDLHQVRRQATFGAADGVVIAVGLIVGLNGQPHAVFRAGLAAGVAELVGMTAGAWLSDSDSGFAPALANGAAALGACVVPVLPYLAAGNLVAMVTALVLVTAVAAVIACMREVRGAEGLIETYGVLAIAALACWAASLI